MILVIPGCLSSFFYIFDVEQGFFQLFMYSFFHKILKNTNFMWNIHSEYFYDCLSLKKQFLFRKKTSLEIFKQRQKKENCWDSSDARNSFISQLFRFKIWFFQTITAHTKQHNFNRLPNGIFNQQKDHKILFYWPKNTLRFYMRKVCYRQIGLKKRNLFQHWFNRKLASGLVIRLQVRFYFDSFGSTTFFSKLHHK